MVAGTDTPLDAALFVAPSPPLEGWALCLGAPPRMGVKVVAVVPPSTGLFWGLGPVLTTRVPWRVRLREVWRTLPPKL